MDKPPTLDTPEKWDAAADAYAEHIAPLLMEAFTEELVDRLDVSPDHEVLEVAAGSGALTSRLWQRVQSLLVTDFAPKMLKIVRERLQAAGANNLQFEVMDDQALELKDASFDRAACSFAVMLFPDRIKGFSEMRRVLKPGGRAVVSAWTGPDKSEMFGMTMAAMQAAFPNMPPPPAPPPVMSLADPAVFKAEMEQAGFADVQVDYVTRTLEVDSFDTVWKMTTSGAPPAKMLLDRVGPGGTERLRETLGNMVQERLGDGPIRVVNVATVGTGNVPA